MITKASHGAPITIFDETSEKTISDWMNEMRNVEHTAGVLALLPLSSLAMIEELSNLNGHISFAASHDESLVESLGMHFPSLHLLRGHQIQALPADISFDAMQDIDLWLMKKWTAPLTVVTMANERALLGAEAFPTNIVLASSGSIGDAERSAFRSVANEWWHAEDDELRSDIPRFLFASKFTIVDKASDAVSQFVDQFWSLFTERFLKLQAISNGDTISSALIVLVHTPNGLPHARETYLGNMTDIAALSSWVRENMQKFNPSHRGEL